MAELPQPIELPPDIISVVGLINSRRKEFFVERWFRNSGFYQDNVQAFSKDLPGWLRLVLIVQVLIYGSAELALFGMEMPSQPTRSRLEARYGEWAFIEIRRVKPEILDEIEKDRPDELADLPVQESGSGGIFGSKQEPKGDSSQSASTILSTPTAAEAVSSSLTSMTKSSALDVTLILTITPTLTPTFTPTSTHTAVPTSTTQPTATSMPPDPPPAQESIASVCHKPGEKQRTLNVPESDLTSHLGHGDKLGACNES